MHRRGWRLLLLVLLLAAGIGAAFSAWSITRQIAELDQRQEETADQIDGLLAAVNAVTAAQEANVTPARDGRGVSASALIEQLRLNTLNLGPHLRAPAARPTLRRVVDGAQMLVDIETRAQEHIRLGQDLMAADLIFSEARSAAAEITAGLRDLRRSEAAAFSLARSASLSLAGTIVGSVAIAWLIGLALLIPLPRANAPEPKSVAVPETASSAIFAIDQRVPEPSPQPDLALAADLCTAIGKLTAAEELPVLLQRAARVLDASGIVLWMAAGEELFVAAAYGYQPQVISKLGPINRSAINATAAAWRSSALQVVSGTGDGRGAIVAPMLGPERCIGALAVEMAVGREPSAASGAIARLFAAQLAAALAGWPAASAAAPADVPPLDRASVDSAAEA